MSKVKKKILICVTNDLTYDQRMIRIANSLSKSYDVTLIGRKKKNSTGLVPQNFDQERLNLFFQKGISFYLEYNLRLFLYSIRKPFDLIYSVDLDTIIACTSVSKIKRKASLFDAHEIYEETPELVGRKIKKKIWTWVAKFFIPHQNKCITVGKELKKYLESKYNNTFEIIRNVPTISEPGTKQSSDNIILYQGALNMGRGLEQMIDAMKDVKQGYKLCLAGEGDLSKTLRIRAQSSPRSYDIVFLGYIKPKELKELTRKAFIGINLIDNISLSYYYSLANKFFDYIQARVPSINMRFPEYENINSKYNVCKLIDSLDPKQIARAINALIDNPEMYNKLQVNCEIASKDLNWKNEEQKLLKIIGSIDF